MDWLYVKLKHFSAKQKETLVYTLARNTLDHMDDKQLSNLRFLFATIVNDEMTHEDGDDIVAMIKEAVLYEKQLNLYRVSKGENFGIRIDKQHEDLDDNGRKVKKVFDFSDYYIEAKVRETEQVVSEPCPGNDERFQEVPIKNLQLDSGSLYVVDLFLRDGFDYRNILDTVYLLVGAGIQSSTGAGTFNASGAVGSEAETEGDLINEGEGEGGVDTEADLEHEIVSE